MPRLFKEPESIPGLTWPSVSLTIPSSIVLSRAIVRDLLVGDALVRVFASVRIVLGAGPILAPFVGAQLLIFTDWRGNFLALAALALVLAAIVASWMPTTLPITQRRPTGNSRVLTNSDCWQRIPHLC
jgi:MFS family permease